MPVFKTNFVSKMNITFPFKTDASPESVPKVVAPEGTQM